MTEDAEAGLPVVEDLDRLEALVRERPGLYLRYSRGPEADRDRPSRDYESGLPLPGLSVTVLSPERWWTRPLRDWLARQVCKYTHLAEADDRRRGWVLAGREVGRGPDHEPLVGDVRPVAWLGERAVAQARAHYRAVFDAGRDSTG
ncbi:hypothetical protein GCM10010106_15100 [Thermopolyspora flexuosa]|jgi:hypothetical protein|uniref:Uncharacterized protein n=1 Tax=Thermopolyspora flexuosa TaxID=103836 RepID=A0A543IPM4_9ACTN|nr:DUF6098 family protein [Thermopolyspora flexuosa]TQM72524.1 hypothetical protein FHX40_4670 [Thermopolyspora flexuosa]GGM69869.1 hypothetical protein GCM10010106_15100 [Thermopolyspora flexuosa]